MGYLLWPSHVGHSVHGRARCLSDSLSDSTSGPGHSGVLPHKAGGYREAIGTDQGGTGHCFGAALLATALRAVVQRC